ncbi:MAG: MarR family transcriptional regulator [Phycisphaerales bacterium]|nr:MarR family transcriptional regulator [Phycisphaerales bacterium]
MAACRVPRPSNPEAAARAEVIELLFEYVERLRAHFESVAQAHDLTPVQAKVVLTLGDSGSMGCVAGSLGCDPSNITGVVDRLEERGLLVRAEASHDRRIKTLKPTAAGRRLREALEVAVFRDVPGLSVLTGHQVADLRRSLAALCGHSAAAPTV